MSCLHAFSGRDLACQHAALPGRDRCLWHAKDVRKDAPYAGRLALAALASHGKDLAEAQLQGIDLHAAGLAGADLRGANLRDAGLDRADLSDASLADADLTRATLRGARLCRADLRGADLTGCSLHGADLSGADLAGAILDGTVLTSAKLDGANLSGAQIRHLRWNGLTSWSAQTAGGDDPTRIIPSAIASVLGALGDQSRLDEPDDDRTRTREFRAIRPDPGAVTMRDAHSVDTAGPGALRRRYLRRTATIAAVVVALAAAGFAGHALADIQATPVVQPVAVVDPALQAAAVAELAQAKATLQQERATASAAAKEAGAARDDLARAREQLARTGAESDRLRRDLIATENDLLRARGADDRAAASAFRLAESRRLAEDLARHSARQERLGTVLAQGVERLTAENQVYAKRLDERLIEVRDVQVAQEETARLRQDLAVLRQAHESVVAANARQRSELDAARGQVERYLARVAESRLGSYLGDDAERQPLIPIAIGQPLSLGGDYLVSLRLDAADRPGQVAATLVVQRPAAAANPDVTVTLHDEDGVTLRRLSFGFPHVDAGAPFVSAKVQVACERQPKFARVVVAPGGAPISSR